MQVTVLRDTLVSLVSDAATYWGSEFSLQIGRINREEKSAIYDPREQVRRNIARLRSGTFTEDQEDDIQRQMDPRLWNGISALVIQGNPNDLPSSVPERVCPKCHNPFRSAFIHLPDIWCYDCEFKKLSPANQQWEVHCLREHDGWHLEVFGKIGIAQKRTFRWASPDTEDIAGYQGLVVDFHPNGSIRYLRLSTLEQKSKRCYVMTYFFTDDSVTKQVFHAESITEAENTPAISGWYWNPYIDKLIIDKLPPMLREHYNGLCPAR